MRPRVVCVVGPTASGKTALGVALAERFGGEIVSVDSRQIYRGLDIGTAKPTPGERARAAHHCLDLVEPDEGYDVARFRDAATAAIAGIVARGRLPLVVGGTGLYLRGLLRGLCPAPPRIPALRAALERRLAVEGAPGLHHALAQVDAASARRLDPRDAVRIVRALEVWQASGTPLSVSQARHAFAEVPYRVLLLGLARPTDELDARIAARARGMLDAGFLEEVHGLRARGVAAEAPGLAAVGYREMLACTEGRLGVDAALAATVLATRRLAKRQRTWFRHEPGVDWYHPERQQAALIDAVDAFLAGPGADAKA
jgi:tRNA dimethylallyltransferase